MIMETVNEDQFGDMSFFMWAEMIRSDQMTHDQVIQFMSNRPQFAEWYRKKYLYNGSVNGL